MTKRFTRLVYRRTATGWKVIQMFLDVVEHEAYGATQKDAYANLMSKMSPDGDSNATFRKIVRNLINKK